MEKKKKIHATRGQRLAAGLISLISRRGGGGGEVGGGGGGGLIYVFETVLPCVGGAALPGVHW